MPHARFTGRGSYKAGEIARRGKDLYEQHVRAPVVSQENIGKIVSIDIETGDYEIG